MKSVEDAYDIIGRTLFESAVPGWSSAFIQTKILKNSCSEVMTEQVSSAGEENHISLGFDRMKLVSNAICFLRDNLLHTTGQRIWGLTFTLFPDGKFNIEYDYNKPDGYEETDEVITGDEINASLFNLNEKNKNS